MVKLGIVTWYETNKSFVAKNYCENKDKPRLKCNGKCYLKKQLDKAEQGQKSRDNKTQHHQLEWSDFLPEAQINFQVYLPFEPATFHDIYKLIKTGSAPDDIFHPPSLTYTVVC